MIFSVTLPLKGVDLLCKYENMSHQLTANLLRQYFSECTLTHTHTNMRASTLTNTHAHTHTCLKEMKFLMKANMLIKSFHFPTTVKGFAPWQAGEGY